MYGADVSQLRALAVRFDQAAEQLDTTRTGVGSAVRSTRWVGPDAESFRGQWDSQSSQRLTAVAGVLRDNARRLRANADGQERASAVDTPTGSATSVGAVGAAFAVSGSAQNSSTGATNDVGTVTRINGPYGSSVAVKKQWGDDFGGTWTTDETAQAGLHGTAGANAGFADDGSWAASAQASGQAGIEATGEISYDNGALSADAGYRSFTGVEGTVSGQVDVGPDGLGASAGARAFAGSELTGNASVDVAGVKAGVDAGITAGIGAAADADVKVSADQVTLSAEWSLTLGIGFDIKPSISFSPKETANTVLGWMGLPTW